jgi:hypothetical protein
MARNRLLFDLLGIILGFGTTGLLLFFSSNQIDETAIFLSIVGLLGGALLLGFFSYRNDGVKIAAILWGILIVGSIILGVILIVGASTFLEGFVDDILTALLGPIFAVILIVLAIMFMVGSVIIGGLFIGFTAIGSAIGEAVWKDKKDIKQVTTIPGQIYVPSQDAYQPAAPAKPQGPGSAVCKQCNASNPSGDKFCINCGAKL